MGKIIDWQIDFGPLVGKKGETKAPKVSLGMAFLAEKIAVATTLDSAGNFFPIDHVPVPKVRVHHVFIGVRRVEFPKSPSPDGGFKVSDWHVCEPWETITIAIEFLEDCTWDCTIFGKAEMHEPRKSFDEVLR